MIAHSPSAGRNFTFSAKGTNLITSCDQEIHVYEYPTLKLQYKVEVGEYIDNLYFFGKDTLFFGGDETGLYSLGLNDSEHKIIRHSTAS